MPELLPELLRRCRPGAAFVFLDMQVSDLDRVRALVEEFILPGSRAEQWKSSAASDDLALIEALKGTNLIGALQKHYVSYI